ncbi:ExbD/TolR family protein [Sulfitobacter aestuarii]|uniref:ExbD/TolR family protein n=1 Tax=Sulfitobacter aestuarii TaxID=2161676 RepID=A0ABW5U889_9RHOB
MTFGDPPARRRPSLTPMIDVVFLLLVFFMLASRFGLDLQMPLNVAGSAGGAYAGPPRLVDIAPSELRLNGSDTPLAGLADSLAELTETPEDTIILRPREGAVLQRIVAVMETLSQAGYRRLVLIGGAE